MSQENVEVVRRAYEATNRGDYDIVESLFHPEIEFHTFGRSPEAGVYHGTEAVRRYNENLFQQFERIRFEIRELVDAGNRVVVMTTQHAVPKRGEQRRDCGALVRARDEQGGASGGDAEDDGVLPSRGRVDRT
jgi:ketosteroid isomerase-like protein